MAVKASYENLRSAAARKDRVITWAVKWFAETFSVPEREVEILTEHEWMEPNPFRTLSLSKEYLQVGHPEVRVRLWFRLHVSGSGQNIGVVLDILHPPARGMFLFPLSVKRFTCREESLLQGEVILPADVEKVLEDEKAHFRKAYEPLIYRVAIRWLYLKRRAEGETPCNLEIRSYESKDRVAWTFHVGEKQIASTSKTLYPLEGVPLGVLAELIKEKFQKLDAEDGDL